MQLLDYRLALAERQRRRVRPILLTSSVPQSQVEWQGLTHRIDIRRIE
jgi:hypothetical protein